LIVIDASIAVKWIVDEPDSSSALLVRDFNVPLIAPDLMLAEFANVMRRKLRGGEVTADQLDAGVSLIKTLIDDFVPTSALIETALVLARQLDHSPYDCIYLACALKRGVLLTADSTFLRKCSQSKHDQSVLSLADLVNGRATAILFPMSIGADTLRAIERLIPLVVKTNISVIDPNVGGYDLASFEPRLDPERSPSAISLEKILSRISGHDAVTLAALGQLGQENESPTDWAAILEQKNDELWNGLMVRSGLWTSPRITLGNMWGPRGIMIQHAYAGLTKLRAHFGITDD
jgi:predicted nucleic acid-binding protein